MVISRFFGVTNPLSVSCFWKLVASWGENLFMFVLLGMRSELKQEVVQARGSGR